MPPIAPANQPANAPANNMAQQLDDLRNDLRNELRDELREEFRIQMARQLAQAECQVRNDLRNEIAQRLGELRSDLRDEIRNLRQEADASDFNAIARGMNSTIFQPQLDLHPLRNRKTNAVIEGFPRTVADIDEMTARDIGRVLRALGRSCQGGMPEKRRRLRLAVGIVLQEL
ncbi:hypothetical protein RB594_006382 [Gaeumannomyces avenae]